MERFRGNGNKAVASLVLGLKSSSTKVGILSCVDGRSVSTGTEQADERLVLSESDKYPFSEKSAQVDALVRAVMLQPSSSCAILSSSSSPGDLEGVKGLESNVACRGMPSAARETFEGTTHGDIVFGKEVEVHILLAKR